MDIRHIDYSEAKNFITDDLLIVKPDYEYYGYFHNNELVSACGLEFKKKYTRIHCNYTKPDCRGRGYITWLIVLLTFNMKGLVKGNCLESSINIYKNLGFNVVGTKTYRGQTAYKVEKVF